MAWSLFVRKTVLLCGCLAATTPALVFGQANYATNGGEYAIAGTLPGDQVLPDVSVTTNGGYVVWQDNATDGDGWGISALRLDSSFSASLSTFRVNQQGANDQINPRVALLKNGGAVFVWQGGQQGFQRIYARFLSSSNTWATGDVLVNTFTNNSQLNPAVAALANGNVVVTWGSFNQAASSSMQDVYAQILSPSGQKIGGESLINQFTAFNQRSPAVAALGNGGYVIVWVSEQQRNAVEGADASALYSPTNLPSVDIFARLFNAVGTPSGNEFLVNSSANVCANPVVAAGSDGGFLVAWGEKNLANPGNNWDIVSRPYSAAAVGGAASYANTYLYGDQYAPRIAVSGTDYLVAWTSLGQDGSREGVFGQIIRGDGSHSGGELRINSTWISQQIQPAISSDGNGRFLTVWSSFVGGAGSFDLYAQRYVSTVQPLQPMTAPFVYAPFVVSNGVYQPLLQVSWPVQAGFSINHYEVYVDGATTPATTATTNTWTLTGIAASSTHNFQVAYVLTDGRRSPLSPAASGTTWGGLSWGGIPFEWMVAYYGSDISLWPLAGARLAPGGPTVLQVFLSGGSPLDPATWLRAVLKSTPQGLFLSWNSQPGATYQVQSSTDLVSWSNLGGSRLAVGTTDSMNVGGGNAGNYRVVRLR